MIEAHAVERKNQDSHFIVILSAIPRHDFQQYISLKKKAHL
jgi:hypothetical protein